MITIIDMVTGKITHKGDGKREPAEQAVPYELPTTPMLQEITIQANEKTAAIPADLATIAVDEFLRNR
jgi:hypothetical protein